MSEVTVAIITGVGLILVALIEVTATFLTSKANAQKLTAALDKQQEVYKAEMNGKFDSQKQMMDYRFGQIEKELQKSNTNSEKIPVMMEQIEGLKEKNKNLEKKIDDIEKRIN